MTKAFLTLTTCATLLSAVPFDTIADAQVTTLPVNKCLAAKIKCVGSYAAAVAKCDTKAAGKTGMIDPECTAKAASKLTNGTNGCLEKAVGRGDCTDTSTQAVKLKGSADAFLHEVVCELDPSNASCDTTPPETILTVAPPPRTGETNAEFQFTSPDPKATFECSLDSGAYAACTSPHTTATLPEGTHTFEVRAIDDVGNVDPTPATATWIIDTTAPETVLTLAPPARTNDTTGDFEFASPDPLPSFECSIDSGAYVACASPFATGALSEGFHSFAVRAVDAVGNADPSPASHTWFVDLTSPETTFTQTEPDPTADPTGHFQFTSEPGASFECSLDGSPFVACVSPYSTPTLAAGIHSLDVRAIDLVGNVDSTPASHVWTLIP